MLSHADYSAKIQTWIATLPPEKQRKYQPRAPRTRAPRVAQASTCDTTGQFQDATATNFDQAGRAMLALHRISVDRAEHYDTWVAVGMALSELGRIGFVLWDEWSKRSAKYSPSACAEKWPTFTRGDGLTIASIFAWANEDNPQQAPSDGCTTECPNRSRLAAHQATIRQLEQEITSLQERNRFVTGAQAAAGIKSASVRDTVVELKKELDSVPLEERREDAFIPIRPAYMAKMANSSPATISRHLRRLEDNGIIERKVETTYDHERDAYVSQTFVRSKVDLTDPSVLVVPSDHGGNRKVRCIKPGCESTNIVDKVERICLDCNTPQGPVKFVPVNEPDDLTDEATYQAAIDDAGVAQALAISSCATKSNVPVLDSTSVDLDGSLPSGLQGEIAPAVKVPVLVREAADLTAAIRAADRYSPQDDDARFAYKSALAWLSRQQPVKAEAYLDRIHEPRARAIVVHLVTRPVAG